MYHAQWLSVPKIRKKSTAKLPAHSSLDLSHQRKKVPNHRGKQITMIEMRDSQKLMAPPHSEAEEYTLLKVHVLYNKPVFKTANSSPLGDASLRAFEYQATEFSNDQL